jgi:hypothetical protein
MDDAPFQMWKIRPKKMEQPFHSALTLHTATKKAPGISRQRQIRSYDDGVSKMIRVIAWEWCHTPDRLPPE